MEGELVDRKFDGEVVRSFDAFAESFGLGVWCLRLPDWGELLIELL